MTSCPNYKPSASPLIPKAAFPIAAQSKTFAEYIAQECLFARKVKD